MKIRGGVGAQSWQAGTYPGSCEQRFGPMGVDRFQQLLDSQAGEAAKTKKQKQNKSNLGLESFKEPPHHHHLTPRVAPRLPKKKLSWRRAQPNAAASGADEGVGPTP